MKKILLFLIIFGLTGCQKLTKIEIDPTVKVEPPTVISEASVIMIGDTVLHRTVYQDAYKKDTKTYDFKKQLSLIKPIISNYDIAYYNQETVLGGTSLGLSDYPRFNSPQEFGDAMIDAGFNMVSLATNHTMDSGEKAILSANNYWKGKQVLTAGSYSSFDERQDIKIFTKNDISYTLLSYTYGTNGLSVPKGKEYLVNVWPMDNEEKDLAYREQVKKDIARVRDKVDILFVAMHWGTEYRFTPTTKQKEIAAFLADLGVDVIIGTHPHVVEPIEWIDDTLVFYSLGNSLSAQDQKMDYAKMVGLMPSFTIKKTVKGDDKKIEITDLKAQLIYNYYQNYHNFLLIPFNQLTDQQLKNRDQVFNKYKEYVNKYEQIPIT